MKVAGIYRIVIMTASGLRFYIGQSHNLPVREKSHMRQLCRGYHENKVLQRDFDMAGAASFEVLVVCAADREILWMYEQVVLDSYDPAVVYNVMRQCVRSPLGTKQPLSANEARSAALRGRKRSPEEIAKSAAARRGAKRSEEAKANMAAAGKGRKLTPEHKAKVVAALRRGVHPPISAETRVKMRNSARNRRKVAT